MNCKRVRLKVKPPYFLSAGHYSLIKHIIKLWTNEECQVLALGILVAKCNWAKESG